MACVPLEGLVPVDPPPFPSQEGGSSYSPQSGETEAP